MDNAVKVRTLKYHISIHAVNTMDGSHIIGGWRPSLLGWRPLRLEAFASRLEAAWLVGWRASLITNVSRVSLSPKYELKSHLCTLEYSSWLPRC